MILEALAQTVLTAIQATGYLGLFVFSLVESAAIPIPSEVVLPFSGFLAAAGTFHIGTVILVATAANVAGSLILYAIGRSGGRWLVERYGRYVFIHVHDLHRADQWYQKHGPATVFWSRLLPAVRTFSSLPAGVARMRIRYFVLYTTIGSAIWNGLLAWVGFKAGENWDLLHGYFQKFDIGIGAAIIILILWFIMRQRHAHHDHVQ